MPAISPVFSGTSKTRRPNAVSFDYQTAFSPGPRAIGDSTLGIVNRAWRVRVDTSNNVFIAAASDDNLSWQAETLLFSFAGAPCLEVDLAFEQAARPVVVMERATGAAGASEVWIYWYDPRITGFTFADFGAGRTPRVILDYPPDVSSSDVQVFYMKLNAGIMRRQQRDLYAVEYVTVVVSDLNAFLDDVAYTRSFQVACIWSADNTGNGQYTLHRMESVPFPIPVKDDNMQTSLVLIVGNLIVVLIVHSLFDIDKLQTSLSLISGTLATPIIFHTLFDIDKLQTSLTLIGGTLTSVIIMHTLYDIDKMQTSLTLVGGTLAVVVITHTLFDIDKMQTSLTLIGGTLA